MHQMNMIFDALIYSFIFSEVTSSDSVGLGDIEIMHYDQCSKKVLQLLPNLVFEYFTIVSARVAISFFRYAISKIS